MNSASPPTASGQRDDRGEVEHLARAPRVGHDEHRNDGDVLRDHDCDDDAAELGTKLADILEDLQRHRRRTHGDDERQQQRLLQGPLEHDAEQAHHQHGEYELADDHQHGRSQVGDERLERYFHADQEQQEQHAEFRQQRYRLRLRHETDHGRSERHASENVADHRRLLQPHHDEAHRHRRERDDGDRQKLWQLFVHAARRCPSSEPVQQKTRNRRTPGRRTR